MELAQLQGFHPDDVDWTAVNDRIAAGMVGNAAHCIIMTGYLFLSWGNNLKLRVRLEIWLLGGGKGLALEQSPAKPRVKELCPLVLKGGQQAVQGGEVVVDIVDQFAIC
jgi:hypothetical protein